MNQEPFGSDEIALLDAHLELLVETDGVGFDLSYTDIPFEPPVFKSPVTRRLVELAKHRHEQVLAECEDLQRNADAIEKVFADTMHFYLKSKPPALWFDWSKTVDYLTVLEVCRAMRKVDSLYKAFVDVSEHGDYIEHEAA